MGARRKPSCLEPTPSHQGPERAATRPHHGCPRSSPTVLPLPVDPQWALGRVVSRDTELQWWHTREILVICNTCSCACDPAQGLNLPCLIALLRKGLFESQKACCKVWRSL